MSDPRAAESQLAAQAPGVTPISPAPQRTRIVGVGASAGGLEAFEALLRAFSPGADLGLALVIVQHLAPDYKSILSELLQHYTTMQVVEVTEPVVVQPGHVYVIPPSYDMTFQGGMLELSAPAAPHGPRAPVDALFCSLAEALREEAIGIVLSGTGSDGTRGTHAISDAGGVIFAQTPESAAYDGMPRSAIATGRVSAILPPAEMPARLLALLGVPRPPPDQPERSAVDAGDEPMQTLFALLRAQTGHDFAQYKPNTILRRVERRMGLRRVATLDAYVQIALQEPEEIASLFGDLLIGVTHFFRDPAAFEAIEQQVIPRLFAQSSQRGAIRVWVPGCSTGEEAYSIAMLLHERRSALGADVQIQVFATDIDRRAIDHARAGRYAPSIAADITPERLARCFTPIEDGGGYQIRKEIRDLLIFSEQDVIRDPPFSKLDLISCRNMLIYLGSTLQKKLIPLFHYALSPTGLLFLGSSETVGEFTALFRPLDRKIKIYERLDAAYGAEYLALWEFLPPMTKVSAAMRPTSKPSPDLSSQLRQMTERTLLEQYAPVGILVNSHGDILYLHGRAGVFLELASGEASLNILSMARPGLRQAVTIALHQAVTHHTPAHQAGLSVRTSEGNQLIDLAVLPIGDEAAQSAGKPLFLVVLEEATAARGAPAAADDPLARQAAPSLDDPDHAASLVALQRELRAKETYLEAANEELATANEELRSSNEELQSVNEELQSTNEELETSKEELQSVNEELSTVNSELQSKVAAHAQANNDLNNLLAGTGVGTVFVDHQLNIQRFTPAVTQVINLIPSDVGRPLGHIVSNILQYDRLVEDVRSVLSTLAPRDIEVQTRAGTWFLLRIRPYRTLEHVIEGAVITFTDVTEIRAMHAALRDTEALRRLAIVVRDSQDAILVHDLTGQILAWNPGAERLYGWSEAEALTMSMRDLRPSGRQEEEATLLQQLRAGGEPQPLQAQRRTKAGDILSVSLSATALVNQLGDIYAIATTERVVA